MPVDIAFFVYRMALRLDRRSVQPFSSGLRYQGNAMSEKALILSADKFNFTDKDTGQVFAGVTVWYVNDYRDYGDESLGFKPTKVNASDEIFEQLRKANLPAVFEMGFGSRPGSQGKASLTLVGVKHVNDVDLFKTTPTSAAKAA